MQAHLQIHNPHDRNAEDDDIGNKVRDASPEPACTRCGAVTEPRGPCCPKWSTLSEIVCDGTDQKPADRGESGDLDQQRVLSAGARHKDPSVQYDQRKLQEAKRDGPGELFHEKCLWKKSLDVCVGSQHRWGRYTLRAHLTSCGVNRSISHPTPPLRIATKISTMRECVNSGSTNRRSA